MNFDHIFPKPKIVELSAGGALVLPDRITWSSDFESPGIEQRFDEMEWRRVRNFAAGSTLLTIRNRDAGAPASIDKERKDEAYRIEVGTRGISIDALTAHGAFNAVSTLLQMLRLANGAPLPAAVIIDWPDVRMRAFHIALADGDAPSIERFVQFVKTLAGLKYNALVIEYDDRFPWVSHPQIAHRNAYTMVQLQRLLQVAEENFVEAIPLLDSLGHAAPYLVHKEYAHLRELPDRTDELCPQNPGSLMLMKELWPEVLTLHKHSRYAHITGDEVFRMGGFCPKCAKFAREGFEVSPQRGFYNSLRAHIRADKCAKFAREGFEVSPQRGFYNSLRAHIRADRRVPGKLLNPEIPGQGRMHSSPEDFRSFPAQFSLSREESTFFPSPRRPARRKKAKSAPQDLIFHQPRSIFPPS
jgi:hypothetical protein